MDVYIIKTSLFRTTLRRTLACPMSEQWAYDREHRSKYPSNLVAQTIGVQLQRPIMNDSI